MSEQGTKFLVDGVLPQGLSVILGRPGVGKSFFARGVGLSVAFGRIFCGFKFRKGAVLYIDSECPRDSQKIWKETAGLGGVPDTLRVAFGWPRIGDGGVKKLDEFFTKNEETRLVVIDVVSGILSKETDIGSRYYHEKRQLERLKGVAEKHETTVLLVHNAKNGEHANRLRRSSAIRIVPDTLLCLERERNGHEGYLDVTGTDVEEHRVEMAFLPQMGGWLDKESARHMRLIGDEQ